MLQSAVHERDCDRWGPVWLGRERQDNITIGLRSYVSTPEVTVIVQEVKSLKFNIVGEIAKPGSYPLSEPMTVLDAIAVGGVKHMALIGHNHCGMVDLKSRKEIFIKGMVNNAGWTKEAAKKSFEKNAPLSEIGNETDFILSETGRLLEKFPKIQIAPMLYLVEDNKLYLIKES